MAKQIVIEVNKITKISTVLKSEPYSNKWEDITETCKEAFTAMDRITAILYTTQKVLGKNPIVMPESNNTDILKVPKLIINALEPIENKLDDLHKECATKQDLIRAFNRNKKNHE